MGGDDPAAQRLHFCVRLLELIRSREVVRDRTDVLGDVHHHDVRALPGECRRVRLLHSARGTIDERYLAVQAAHIASPSNRSMTA
jgi:hypothetical protein